MKPELAAALTATTLVHVVLAASMYAAHLIYRKRIPGTRYWFIATVAIALGHGFFVLSPVLPAFIDFTIPNMLLSTGVVAAAFGAAFLSGRSASQKLFATAEAAVAILFILFGLISPSFYVRSLMLASVSILGTAFAAYCLFFPISREDRTVTAVGGAIFSIFAVMSVCRMIGLLASPNMPGGVDTPSWYVMFVNLSLALYVSLGVAFYLMVGGLLTRSLERSLSENKLLLSEMRHRTKNNLSLIGSLVSLQGNEIEDPAAKGAFRELGERIKTITTVYRMLSRVEDGHEADTQRYLDSLAAGIRDSIFAGRKEVEFIVRVESRMLDARQLVALGLIVNELATNSIKYAFVDKRLGVMRLDFRTEGKFCVLVFSDNGIGLDELKAPDGEAVRHSEGLGLTLVRTLVEQLRGELRTDSSPEKGTTYTLRFPE